MSDDKVEEKKEETHAKKGINLGNLVKGKDRKEKLEKISYLIIVISAAMVSVGIGLGSFIQGTVFVSVIGAFLVMVGIVAYIASQLIGE